MFLFQMKALKTAHKNNKGGRWWIKADATDVNKGLRESMKNVWSGDVDFRDGSVKKMHDEYLQQLRFVRNIGLKDRPSTEKIRENVASLKVTLDADELFLKEGLIKSRELYNAQIKRSKVSGHRY